MSEGSPKSDEGAGSSIKEQDRFLPIANVSRIMKRALPPNAKISKDAKETVQECVSEFISFITGEASDKCQREKRKTINGDDLLWAMNTLGFEFYVEPLRLYLQKYREVEGEKTSLAKNGSASSSSSVPPQTGEGSSSPRSPSSVSKMGSSSGMIYASQAYAQSHLLYHRSSSSSEQHRTQW
eukprot:TRINITY_DN14021_c0_g1_i1.p1 TRINITY_DN14021_c0_g1~~TRINITY_DN14021_c0_g1_i1.p1  ORF type:complete len:182 (+),score=41.68 TRINITY_DN14021_c0_g1_i1:569-1114(+)